MEQLEKHDEEIIGTKYWSHLKKRIPRHMPGDFYFYFKLQNLLITPVKNIYDSNGINGKIIHPLLQTLWRSFTIHRERIYHWPIMELPKNT